jgi:hypothetical protein
VRNKIRTVLARDKVVEAVHALREIHALLRGVLQSGASLPGLLVYLVAHTLVGC